MKKFIIAAILSVFLLTGCSEYYNVTLIDTTYKFDKAIITISNEQTIEVSVKSWLDFENSDTVQIVATDGTVYLTHYTNVVLIKEK